MAHRERTKHTVEKERSPPDRERMSLKSALFPWPGCTYRGVDEKPLLNKKIFAVSISCNTTWLKKKKKKL